MKYADTRFPSNLTRNQRAAIQDIKNNDDIKVIPFDKGVGFALMSKTDMMTKISEHLGTASVVNKDPTQSIVKKFQKELSRTRKEGKMSNKLFFRLYPSDAVPPRLYGYLKAHKPAKNYPMRPVVSTLGTPMYESSKYLVDIIQPTLNKNEIRVKNSSSFVEEAKTWEIGANEVQCSFDVVNLYPSVPIGKAIDVMVDLVQADFDDIQTRTQLSVTDIKILLELCLSTCYFLWDDKARLGCH